jgi:hypothetical protein
MGWVGGRHKGGGAGCTCCWLHVGIPLDLSLLCVCTLWIQSLVVVVSFGSRGLAGLAGIILPVAEAGIILFVGLAGLAGSVFPSLRSGTMWGEEDTKVEVGRDEVGEG